MLTDGRTDARTDDRRKVITIAHPEQSSGELKKHNSYQIFSAGETTSAAKEKKKKTVNCTYVFPLNSMSVNLLLSLPNAID